MSLYAQVRVFIFLLMVSLLLRSHLTSICSRETCDLVAPQ
jgi:hypothetical protein